MGSSRSRWRFCGEVRLVLLLSRMKRSFSSNHTGLNCTDPSSRFVATPTRIGSAASFRNARLSVAAVLPPAIDRASDPQRLDLDLDSPGARVLIVAHQRSMRHMGDVVA